MKTRGSRGTRKGVEPPDKLRTEYMLRTIILHLPVSNAIDLITNLSGAILNST